MKQKVNERMECDVGQIGCARCAEERKTRAVMIDKDSSEGQGHQLFMA